MENQSAFRQLGCGFGVLLEAAEGGSESSQDAIRVV